LEKQRERARQSWRGDETAVSPVYEKFVAKERGPALLNEFLIDGTDRRLIASPALARAFALFFKFRFEAVHIKPHRFFVGDFFSEIERKSIGVVELENFDAGNDIFGRIDQLMDRLFKSL